MRHQATAAAEAAAQRQRESHAAQYQDFAEAHAALTPQAELNFIEGHRQREQYQTMQSCILQTLMQMKAMRRRPGIHQAGPMAAWDAETEHGAGGGLLPDGCDVSAVVTDGGPKVLGPVAAMDVDTARVVDGNAPTSAPAWHESRAVLTARICARPQSSIASSPSAFITKLLGPRRFKSVKGRPRC